MTTQEIANKWVELVRAHKDEEAMTELYAPEIESIENNAMQGTKETHNGFEGKAKKNKMWHEMIKEMHEVRVSDPVVADRAFACSIFMDVTYNDENLGRQALTELAVLEIKDGKIIHEEYIY